MSKPGKRQRERDRKQRRFERRAHERANGTTGAKATGADPVRGALAPVIDETLCWHMARTAPLLGPLGRKHLDEALTKSEVQAYRPRASEIVVRRGRRVVRHVPLLIRTLIIGVRDAEHLASVAKLPGVAEIVSHPEVKDCSTGNITGSVLKPARLDPQALQRFMVALAAGEVVKPVGVEIGSQVVVLDNRFYGFPGIVEKILPGDRIKVAVSIFGRPSPVELRIADVQRL